MENKEKLRLFPSLTASEQTYEFFLHPKVSLPLQIYQQYFNVLKPQRYNKPDIHVSHIFLMVYEKNKVMLGNWGENILRDLRRSINTQAHEKIGYVGCATVLTKIVYHALGMVDDDIQVLELDEDLI